MSQTVVRQALRPGIPGSLYDTGFHDIVSRDAEGVVQFGAAIIVGTDVERQCLQPVATFTGVLGVAIRDNKEQQFVPTLGQNEYDDEDTVGILQEGRCWVPLAETVAALDAGGVFFWFVDGDDPATALAGQWGNTTDAADNEEITAGMSWFKGGTVLVAPAIGVAVLQVGPFNLLAP